MWMSYVVGLTGIVLIATAWVGVQRWWKTEFPGLGDDPDALAGRLGCHGCAAPGSCTKTNCESSHGDKEDLS